MIYYSQQKLTAGFYPYLTSFLFVDFCEFTVFVLLLYITKNSQSPVTKINYDIIYIRLYITKNSQGPVTHF